MGATRLASGKDAAIIYRVPFSTPTRDASPPLVLAFLQNAAHNKQCASANIVCTRTKKYYIVLN